MQARLEEIVENTQINDGTVITTGKVATGHTVCHSDNGQTRRITCQLWKYAELETRRGRNLGRQEPLGLGHRVYPRTADSFHQTAFVSQNALISRKRGIRETMKSMRAKVPEWRF